MYSSKWPHGEATAYALRALAFVTQALDIRLHIEWKKRRSDKVSKIADDLTHSKFSLVDAKVVNRRVSSLPHPILQTLLESCKFKAHIYHKFVKAITLFWKEANVSFK